MQSPKVEGVTRTGRNIIKPSRCRNYALLLAGLITSQFVSNVDNEFTINQTKQLSFFQAQLDHKVATNKLPDGTNNAFEPLLFQAQESSNGTLHYGQAMKAHDAEQFKEAMKKEMKDLKEAEVFELIPITENQRIES